MPKLEYMDKVARRGIEYFPCLEYDTAPWTPMAKELSECKVALISSAGLHLRTDKPFLAHKRASGDPSFRVIPSSVKASAIIQSHVSIGFDRTGVYRDINIVFPVDRLRELVNRGVIGSVAEHYYSFHGGAQRNTRPLRKQIGPELARRLKDDGVDVVFMTTI